MPELDPDPYIQIIRFNVKSEDQSALTDAIFGEVDRWIRHCDGFLSANFHVSKDREWVVNYAQWRDESAYQAFLDHPEQEALGRAIDRVGPKSADANAFSLIETFLPG